MSALGRSLGLVCLAVLLALSAQSALAAKPRIKILATGGTIAGAQASQAEYGYKSGAFDVRGPHQRRAADERSRATSAASRSSTSAART